MKRNSHIDPRTMDAVATMPTPVRPQVRQPDERPTDERHPVSNQAAVDLLESWQTGDEQEQSDTWAYLKQVLQEDRLSDRTLLP